MSPEDLTNDEKSLLVECGDDNTNFQLLIYDIHFTYPQLDIWEKYQIAFNLIVSSVEKRIVEIFKVDYKQENDYRIPISYIPISLNFLRELLKHPKSWQTPHDENLEISITPLGESLLKQIMAN
jgi:hypothetical protein